MGFGSFKMINLLFITLSLFNTANAETLNYESDCFWPTECGADEYTDYCLETWESNKEKNQCAKGKSE